VSHLEDIRLAMQAARAFDDTYDTDDGLAEYLAAGGGDHRAIDRDFFEVLTSVGGRAAQAGAVIGCLTFMHDHAVALGDVMELDAVNVRRAAGTVFGVFWQAGPEAGLIDARATLLSIWTPLVAQMDEVLASKDVARLERLARIYPLGQTIVSALSTPLEPDDEHDEVPLVVLPEAIGGDPVT